MQKYREGKDRLEYEQMMNDPSTAYLVDDAESYDRHNRDILPDCVDLILGPIVTVALSVWDGFQSTLTMWIQRYIQTYLWLPVADLFSTILAKIQVLMLQNDISELTNNPNADLDGTNTAYVIFMIIGIIGYFTIPTVAGGLSKPEVPETTIELSTIQRCKQGPWPEVSAVQLQATWPAEPENY